MQARAGQVRDRGLERVEAIIERQERVPPKRNHDGLLLDRQHRGARLLGAGALVLDRGALLPLGDRLRVDAVPPGQAPQALLTMLDRSTHRRRRTGAPMQNLAHSASFHSNQKCAPSKPGTKQLVGRLPWDLVWWCGDPRAPRCPMSRHQKDPLRPLTADECQELTRLSRSLRAPAAQVERSRALMEIAAGATSAAAPRRVQRGHNDSLVAWVTPVNRGGLAAVRPVHGGGPRIRYGADAQ